MTKKLHIIMMLAITLALTACTQTPEDMLIGTWQMKHATETVSVNGQSTTNELPGYDNYIMEFVKEGYCAVTVRGERTVYTWYLVDDNTLLLTLENWVEDYSINELTKNHLVYNDTYNRLDTLTNTRTYYTYTFEFDKK